MPFIFDDVSLKQGNQESIIKNGGFEENIDGFVSNEKNLSNPPSDTWWIKTNTNANPTPQCTLEIITPGR